MRTCEVEGCARKHRARGYCSKHYNEIVAGPDRHKVTRHCNECDTEYTTTRSNGKYCSLACRDKVMRREKRVRFKERPPREPKPKHYRPQFSTWILRCEGCGKQYNHTRITKYCSTSCSQREAWRKKRERQGGKPIQHWLAKGRTCLWCGEVFHSKIPQKKYCCSHCNHAAARERGARPRGSDWITKSRRLGIYERDHYLCWLCGLPTDATVDPRKNDNAPTLDHVVPRSKGGKDDDSNLRCAHRICNSLRGNDDVQNTQLELVLS